MVTKRKSGRGKRILTSGLAACLSLILVACGSSSEPEGTDQETVEAKLILEFLPVADHAVWVAADEQGYFADEGLEIEILPGEGFGPAMQKVESGAAEIGVTDIASLALARTANDESNVSMIAALEAQAPYTIFSLADGANIQNENDIEGNELFAPLDSSLDDIVRGWASAEGVETDFKNVNPANQYALLVAEKIPTVVGRTGSVPSVASSADEAGKELVTFDLADHGLTDVYGAIVVARGDFAEEHPDALDGFLRATRKAFAWTFDNPEEAIDLLLERFPTLPRDQSLARLEIYRELVTDGGDIPIEEVGAIDPARVEKTLDLVRDGLPDGDISADDLFTSEHLE